MKKILQILILTAFAVSCAEKVEPETPGPETPGPETPCIGELIYRGNALFAEYEDKWLGYEPWEMTKSAEGLSGEGGSFVYWWDHRTEAKTSDELHAMCDIPEEKLLAMSTANLVRTCYIYPYNADIAAYFSPGVSFLDGIHYIMDNFNGYRELHLRKDAPQEMLSLYKEVWYSDWDGKSTEIIIDSRDYRKQSSICNGIASLSLIAASAVDNNRFTPEQIAELSEGVIRKIDEILSDESGTYSFFTAFFPYLLGAVISYHYDSTLTQEQLDTLDEFVWVCNRATVEEPTLELIYESLGRIGA